MEDKVEDTSPEINAEQYERELVMENAYRLEDLAMALCHYDNALAKEALSVALGTLMASYAEPTLVECMEFAEAQIDAINDARDHVCDECVEKINNEHNNKESN